MSSSSAEEIIVEQAVGESTTTIDAVAPDPSSPSGDQDTTAAAVLGPGEQRETPSCTDYQPPSTEEPPVVQPISKEELHSVQPPSTEEMHYVQPPSTEESPVVQPPSKETPIVQPPSTDETPSVQLPSTEDFPKVSPTFSSTPSTETASPKAEQPPCDVKELTIRNLDTGEEYVIGENDPDFEFDTFALDGGR
jgi:hypothetical protein